MQTVAYLFLKCLYAAVLERVCRDSSGKVSRRPFVVKWNFSAIVVGAVVLEGAVECVSTLWHVCHELQCQWLSRVKSERRLLTGLPWDKAL